jgi:hypothetical protein
LPHFAKRLDNNPTLLNPHEVLISVQLVFLPERNLVLSLKKQGADSLSQGITKAITDSGKICAPPGEDAKERYVRGNVYARRA